MGGIHSRTSMGVGRGKKGKEEEGKAKSEFPPTRPLIGPKYPLLAASHWPILPDAKIRGDSMKTN